MPVCEFLVSQDIAINCSSPIFAGIKPLGIIINKNDIASISQTGNVVDSIVLKSGKKGYQIEQMGQQPFNGTNNEMQEGDVMVFASRGGKTKELLPILDICKRKGVRVITITENLESPLATGADVVLKQYVNRETDKYNSQGTTSSTALCMIFHALQTALIEETDYKNEQFALIHPGGAVGERLNK